AHGPAGVLLPELAEAVPADPGPGPAGAGVAGEGDDAAEAVLPLGGDGVLLLAAEGDEAEALAFGGDDVAGDGRDGADAAHGLGGRARTGGGEGLALPDECPAEGLGLLDEDLGEGFQGVVAEAVEGAAGLQGHGAERVEVAGVVRLDADGGDGDAGLADLA